MALTKVRGKGLGTLGDGTASDNSIVFDGNAQDFHIGLDDSEDKLTIGLGSTLGTTSHMTFDSTGAILKPLQPAFLAFASTNSNLAIDVDTDVGFGTEVYDQNGDFSSKMLHVDIQNCASYCSREHKIVKNREKLPNIEKWNGAEKRKC